MGRSFKFHRPRGIVSAGIEESNALVTLGAGAFAEPTARATMIPLREHLEVRPQNCWPGVSFDVGRVLDWLSPLCPAGFYNKTFIWPAWHFYEPYVRAAAGLGRVPGQADVARYEAVAAECDLLVVGAGPAGLQAARSAARAGLSVWIAEQDLELGGELLRSSSTLEGRPAMAWVENALTELHAAANVTVRPATTVFGLYDHGCAGLIERVHALDERAAIRERYWRVRARQTLLATGAIEQPLLFEHNDLPGVMLAGAIRQYANRFGVSAGSRIVFATNNDSAYRAALDLATAGVDVPLLIDSRADTPIELTQALRAKGVDVRANTIVLKAAGSAGLHSVRLRTWAPGHSTPQVSIAACDALGMSGGWSPTTHLFSHAGGKLDFDATRACFVPRAGTAPVLCAGAVTGAATLADTFASAHRVTCRALQQAGVAPHHSDPPFAIAEPGIAAQVGGLRRSRGGRARRQWIDFQHDVTVADVELALREGYESIEHLKRYTTTGMSVDQGKTSNLNALLTVAEISGCSPAEIGTTTYRPPYSPVTLGALAGRQIGERYAPRPRLPAHTEHQALVAQWLESGGWQRPTCYPRPGESGPAAIHREVLAVRTAVGLFDASPLGKIEVTGPDAASFLDRFYVNNVCTLELGRTRYGLMLNENGIVIDDGTIARLGPEQYLITTTSAGAERVGRWLEEWRQCEWPHMNVFTAPVTGQWATIAISGPRSRDVLSQLESDVALDRNLFPHLHVREGTLGGVPTRLYRVSFSGELGYEINITARYGASLWRALLSAGEDAAITPYGVEALMLLRLEKGFLHVGADTDGTTTPADVGWGGVALRKQADFIGKRSLMRADNRRADRLQLVGLLARDPQVLVPGAHLRLRGTTEGTDGWVTSAAVSPTLGKPVALAMLRGGRSRLDESVSVHDLDRQGAATVVATPFYDPEGARLHA
jgi:sarcosine oxidase subunit alpha